MKKIMIATLALVSLTAFAHPDIKDSLDTIGTGSKLIVKRDLNFKPNHSEL